MARIILCGSSRPGPRDPCPDPVHDWPEPGGYVSASEVAGARLRRGWHNVPCGQCDLYGWRPGRIDPTTDHHVPAGIPTKEETDGT